MTGVICDRVECGWNSKASCTKDAIHLRVVRSEGMGGKTVDYKCRQFELVKPDE